MSDIQHYLLSLDSQPAEAAKVVKKTAAELESRQLKLVALIETLGEYLNNDDAAIRIKTVAYLADVLEQVSPSGVLNRQHKALLVDFVQSRISNGAEGVGHCARALRALDKMGQLEPAKVSEIVETLLENVSPLVQVKQQSERYSVLVLVDVLVSKHRDTLKTMHEQDPTFAGRLISFFDAEKDPRNLMIVFSLLHVFMVEWDLSAGGQEFFDAAFNYFPITFRPPPDDPYGITAQDLKNRLRDCISANGQLAPYAFPALLDKLDSTSTNVKRDALQAIAACAANYGPATMNLYSVTLWDALKFEVLNVQEEDLAEEALKALHEIARSLSSSSHDGPVAQYLKPIVKECNEHLEDAPTKQSTGSGRMLAAISRASLEVSSMLLRGVLPQICALYQSADSASRRRGLLEVLNKLVDANADLFGQWRKQEIGGPARDDSARHVSVRPATNALADFSEQLIELLVGALTVTPMSEVSYRLMALDGLRGLSRISQLLSDAVLTRIIRILDQIVIEEESYGKDEVKTKSMDALVEIARQKPQLVIETALPAFMAQLPDNDVDSKALYMPVLEAFAKLSAEPQIFSTVTLRLKNKLYAALRQNASSTYVMAILSALLFGFRQENIDLSSPAIFGPYYQDILIPFLQNICASGHDMFPESVAINEERVLGLVGCICNVILRPQPWVAQTEVCRNLYILFRPGASEDYPPFAPAKDDVAKMVVSTYLLAALQRQASPHSSHADLLSSLVSFAARGGIAAPVRTTAITQIALLVNKFFTAKLTAEVIQPLLDPSSPTSIISPSASSPAATINLRIAFAILKAIVFRIDPVLPAVIPHFLALLGHDSFGGPAAQAFAQILAPDNFLTKENHCVIYNLSRQRFFSLAVPALLQAYREAAQAGLPTRDNYLAALAGTTQYVPYELLISELSRIVPLLLQSLSLSDDSSKAAALAALEQVVARDPTALQEHLGSLVQQLLGVANRGLASDSNTKSNKQKQDPPRIRAAALTVLASFVDSGIKEESLVPWQRLVVHRLWTGALDDPRREVRQQAVRCRTAWAGLSGGDDDDDDR